jgi:hypothetical protein
MKQHSNLIPQQPPVPGASLVAVQGGCRRGIPAAARRLGGSIVTGLLLAGAVLVPLHGQGQSLAPDSGATFVADARPRPATLDARVRRLEEGLGSLDERLSRAAEARAAMGGVQADRLALALLHLETVVSAGRPWVREWQLILSLDGPALMPQLYLEVLGSHAARGLPSARDLSERFELLAPAIAARAASEMDFLQRAMNAVRGTLSGIGLVAPVEPGLVDTALASIREHLRRGELSGALAEVATLDAEQQALLAGWLAQMRARVAVEQSLQDAILGLLAGTGRQG